MLGRLLEDLGLFAGTLKDENNEAIFFQEINAWLLSQCGGRWDEPSAIRYLWQHEQGLPWIEDYIRTLLASPRSVRFLGMRRMLQGGINGLDTAWGWKDPRNTFTLPMWLRIFPEAKVISIERHGVDVAQSLRVREREMLRQASEKFTRLRRIAFVRLKGGGFVESPRCTELAGGFSLWQEYVTQARWMLAQLPPERALALRYEDVLDDPRRYLRQSADFCGLEVSDKRLEEVVGGIRADRANSYMSDSELGHFANGHRAELGEFGYSA
ncbi:sulfotransferase [Bradyrhizobium lablabi]|uniref:sulfotransferase family protein n=1 Tax=Bradyrhizobium lablabi TaxID=722472 RepID=UPI001BA4B045|nr:sulfotransferase [Bradyrhizobium lablabi]MBR1120186.1 sulfotransferase [Bradyrhizobium lablabi]